MKTLTQIVLVVFLASLAGCATITAEVRITEYGVGTGLAAEARGVRIVESGRFSGRVEVGYQGEAGDVKYLAGGQ